MEDSCTGRPVAGQPLAEQEHLAAVLRDGEAPDASRELRSSPLGGALFEVSWPRLSRRR